MDLPYTAVRNLVWANVEHTKINVEATFKHLPEESVPLTISPDDCTTYGSKLFAACVTGDFGEIAEYAPPSTPTMA